MTTTPKLIIDGLWHCLCPSYNSALVSTRHALRLRRRPAPQCASRRQQSTAAVASLNPHRFNTTLDALPQSLRSDLPFMNAWAPLDSAEQSQEQPQSSRNTPRHHRLMRSVDFPHETTPALYEVAKMAAMRGNSREARTIVEYLVKERREEPNLRLYSILILANVEPAEGAAWRVAALLEEMQKENLTIDQGICHDVLRVLSVHLDYLLRADILHYMQSRWFQLNPEGHHWVCAALFREGQLELGLEQLETMRKENIPPPTWLYDLSMYALLETGEFDEALVLLKQRIAGNDSSISESLWTHMLDTASSAFHYATTVYVWNSRVIPGYLIPSSGTSLNVLTTASRAGDASLATSVFHTLGKRSTFFRPIHYNQLVQTYMSTTPPDLRAAMTVLTIMTSVKLEPTTESTRPIFSHLKQHPEKCPEAFLIVQELHEAGRALPIAALNLILEAYVENRDLEKALVTYKHMHLFEAAPIPGKPTRRTPFSDLQTFNLLLRGASRSRDAAYAYDSARFLVSEMLALGIVPDFMVYDRLIWICVHVGNLENAWRYFDEMEGLGFSPRAMTVKIVAEALARVGDERCWDVLQRMHDRGVLEEGVKGVIEGIWEESSSSPPSSPSSPPSSSLHNE